MHFRSTHFGGWDRGAHPIHGFHPWLLRFDTFGVVPTNDDAGLMGFARGIDTCGVNLKRERQRSDCWCEIRWEG